MMKQSYTSFLNIVHQKANIHIFVIKVNKSTSQRVNKSTSQRVNESTSQQVNKSTSQRVNESTGQRVEIRWVRLGRKGLEKQNTH